MEPLAFLEDQASVLIARVRNHARVPGNRRRGGVDHARALAHTASKDRIRFKKRSRMRLWKCSIRRFWHRLRLPRYSSDRRIVRIAP